MGLAYSKREQEGMVEVGEDVEILAIDYSKLVPVSIKAIQEQQKIIETQQQELNQLKTELAIIKTLLQIRHQ